MNPLKPANSSPVTFSVRPSDYHNLGVQNARGHAERIMSRSELMEFYRNPARWRGGYKEEGTKATIWGSLVDCIALTPADFSKLYAIAPAVYPAKNEDKPWNRNADFCKSWEDAERKAGREVISRDLYDQAREAVTTLRLDPVISQTLSDAQTQVQVLVTYTDAVTGITVPVKVLIDVVPADKQALADLKTTNDASPAKWSRHVFNYDMHVQAGLYLDAWSAATNEKRTNWLHIVQESEPPYAVARRMLSPDYINMGRAVYRNALQLYCQCLQSNEWPGYDDLHNGLNGDVIDGWRMTEPSPWMLLV